MANRPFTIFIAVIILFCCLSGCLNDSSEELEVKITELEDTNEAVSYTHLREHETRGNIVFRLMH